MRSYLVLGMVLFSTGSTRALTRPGRCEVLPSADVPADGFRLSGPIYQLVPDRFRNNPFVVFANHTDYGSCLKVHLAWMPNYTNVTLSCDCAPEGARVPTSGPVTLAGIDPETAAPWSNIQLVFAVPRKFAVLYGCYDHGNGSVSEGAIALGRTPDNFDDYRDPQQSIIFEPFFPFHRRLHETMQAYTMNRSTERACKFRHEFYLHRGLTSADIIFVALITIIAATLAFSVCLRLCLPRLRVCCGQ